MQVSGAAAPGLRGRRLRLGGTLALRSRRLSACPPQGYPPPAIPVLLLRAAGGAPPPAPSRLVLGSVAPACPCEDRGSYWILAEWPSLRISFPLSPACSTLGSRVASLTPRAASCQSLPSPSETSDTVVSIFCLLPPLFHSFHFVGSPRLKLPPTWSPGTLTMIIPFVLHAHIFSLWFRTFWMYSCSILKCGLWLDGGPCFQGGWLPPQLERGPGTVTRRRERILDAENWNYVVPGPWLWECLAWNLEEHGLFSEIYSFIISPLHFFTSAGISVLRCVSLINSCFATISLRHRWPYLSRNSWQSTDFLPKCSISVWRGFPHSRQCLAFKVDPC